MSTTRRPLLAALLLLAPALGGWSGSGPLGPDVARSDVFVIAGQSNAVGSSSLPPVPTTYFGSAFDSWVYDLCSRWEPANDPLHCYVTTGRTSAWPTFADLWTHEMRRPVVFVATAVGGTCLVGGLSKPAHWNPDGAEGSEEGQLYRTMRKWVEKVVQPADRLRAVLWYQGECEVGHRVPFAPYKAALMRLADRIQQDLGVPLIVAPVSLRPPPWPLQPQRIPIHDATIAAASEHPNILLGPDTDDLAHEDDGSHVRDVVTLGRRWFAAARSVAPPECNDGRDGDGDGHADYPEDRGCVSLADRSERQAFSPCDDGVDNDGDDRIDFPADSGCASPQDWGERGAGCGLGFEVAWILPLLGARRRRAAPRRRGPSRRGRSRLPVLALLAAFAVAAGAGGANAEEAAPSDVTGRYRVSGETTDKATGIRRAISGTVSVRQDGAGYRASFELRTVLPGSQAQAAEAQVMGTGSGTIEGNTLRGTAQTQILSSPVPGVDAGFVGMPRLVSARIRSSSLATLGPDGSIEIEIDNEPAEGDRYRPTRTVLRGRREAAPE